MKKIKNILTVALLAVFVSCSSGDTPNPAQGPGGSNLVNDGTWSIPENEVFDGGPGKDGIPALLNPEMINSSDAGFMLENELVIGIKSGNDIRAYPHHILDWHEIVNDDPGDISVAITYCPLTGTATGWDRDIGGKISSFGVSGLLYKSNLIPYDRLTDSNWSQMQLECVNGGLKGEKINLYQVVETTWSTWKKMYPATKVLSRNTGHSRNYGVYPYGDYKTNNYFLLFPVTPSDGRLPQKERVMGVIIDGNTRAYRFDDFQNQVRIIEDVLGGEELIVIGSSEQNFMVAFYSETSNARITGLETSNLSDGIIMKDQEGNEWNIFGEGISGPRKGEFLKRPKSFIGYWFAWAAFYPGIDIYSE